MSNPGGLDGKRVQTGARVKQERPWRRVHNWERLVRQVVRDGDCIVFAGKRKTTGYGLLSHHRTTQHAHRVAWEIAHGPIPAGLSVMHACDNPPCVRIDHLRLGTHAQNMADMVTKGRSPQMGGEKNGNRKLSASEARQIRDLADARALPQKYIAAMYGVSFPTVSAIKARRLWRHA